VRPESCSALGVSANIAAEVLCFVCCMPMHSGYPRLLRLCPSREIVPLLLD
jgi:hypothetical protein